MFCVNCWYRVSRESCEDIEEGFLIEIGRIRRVFWRRGFMDQGQKDKQELVEREGIKEVFQVKNSMGEIFRGKNFRFV